MSTGLVNSRKVYVPFYETPVYYGDPINTTVVSTFIVCLPVCSRSKHLSVVSEAYRTTFCTRNPIWSGFLLRVFLVQGGIGLEIKGKNNLVPSICTVFECSSNVTLWRFGPRSVYNLERGGSEKSGKSNIDSLPLFFVTTKSRRLTYVCYLLKKRYKLYKGLRSQFICWQIVLQIER